MIMSTDGTAVLPYLLQPVPTLAAQAEPMDPLWRAATEVGTGGYATLEYYLVRGQFPGYVVLRVSRAPAAPHEGLSSPVVERMQMIRSAFGRNFSRLPAIFDVSRQTLYNWIQGEQPKIAHHARIEALAEAAQVFLARSYTPTAGDLGRSLLRGKSFIELISQGENGRTLAEKLMRLVCQGIASRDKLNVILAGTSAPRVTPSDFGSPAFDENSE
jgi:hypothetical protein